MRIKALQLPSAGLASWGSAARARFARGRLVQSGGEARWATVTRQRRSQLSAEPLCGGKSGNLSAQAAVPCTTGRSRTHRQQSN